MVDPRTQMHITSATNLPKTWSLFPLCAFTSICPGAVIPYYWYWSSMDRIPAWTHVPTIHGEEKQAAPVISAHPCTPWHICYKTKQLYQQKQRQVSLYGVERGRVSRAQSCHQSAAVRSAHTWAALDGVHEVRAPTQPSPPCLNHGVT